MKIRHHIEHLAQQSHSHLANMASLRAPSASFLSAFLPVARASLIPQQPIRRIPLLQQIQQRLNATILPAALVPIPALLGELWEGILKAVPKKKTSHMKKRHRQMAGKALKDVTALNKCSACGRVKRAHILCPHCVLSTLHVLRRVGSITDKFVQVSDNGSAMALRVSRLCSLRSRHSSQRTMKNEWLWERIL